MVMDPLTNTGGEGDVGSTPGLGRSPEESNGNTLQHSCLGSPLNRGAYWATGCAITKSQTQLSN